MMILPSVSDAPLCPAFEKPIDLAKMLRSRLKASSIHHANQFTQDRINSFMHKLINSFTHALFIYSLMRSAMYPVHPLHSHNVVIPSSIKLTGHDRIIIIQNIRLGVPLALTEVTSEVAKRGIGVILLTQKSCVIVRV